MYRNNLLSKYCTWAHNLLQYLFTSPLSSSISISVPLSSCSPPLPPPPVDQNLWSANNSVERGLLPCTYTITKHPIFTFFQFPYAVTDGVPESIDWFTEGQAFLRCMIRLLALPLSLSESSTGDTKEKSLPIYKLSIISAEYKSRRLFCPMYAQKTWVSVKAFVILVVMIIKVLNNKLSNTVHRLLSLDYSILNSTLKTRIFALSWWNEKASVDPW